MNSILLIFLILQSNLACVIVCRSLINWICCKCWITNNHFRYSTLLNSWILNWNFVIAIAITFTKVALVSIEKVTGFICLIGSAHNPNKFIGIAEWRISTISTFCVSTFRLKEYYSFNKLLNRHLTAIPSELPIVFTARFYEDENTLKQWRAFRKKLFHMSVQRFPGGNALAEKDL